MTNAEFFKEYGSETWSVEENLDYLLMQYWEEVKAKYGHLKIEDFSKLPISGVDFIKRFMKSETIVGTDWVEKSKMQTLEDSVVVDVEG